MKLSALWQQETTSSPQFPWPDSVRYWIKTKRYGWQILLTLKKVSKFSGNRLKRTTPLSTFHVNGILTMLKWQYPVKLSDGLLITEMMNLMFSTA